MATEAQIAANRRNAQKSTGPRTAEGKARSCLNHLIHGLTAQGLLPGESPETLAAIQESLRDQFHPQGAAEEILVERMANSYFRLGRFTGVEAELLQRDPAEDASGWDSERHPYSQTTENFTGQARRLLNLGQYESRLERAFDRALRELIHLQTFRAKQAKAQAQADAAAAQAAAPASKIGFEIPPRPAPLPAPVALRSNGHSAPQPHGKSNAGRSASGLDEPSAENARRPIRAER
jgi:hypothetical protein